MAALPRPCLVESILFTSRPQTTFFSAPGRAPARAAGRGGRHPRATAHALSFRFRVGNQGRAHSSKVQLDVRNSGLGRASPRAAPRAPDASAFSHSHVAAGERVSPRAHASSHSHSTGSCLFLPYVFTLRARNERSVLTIFRSLVRSSRVHLVTCTLIYVMQGCKDLASRVRRASSRATAACAARGRGAAGGRAGRPEVLHTRSDPRSSPRISPSTAGPGAAPGAARQTGTAARPPPGRLRTAGSRRGPGWSKPRENGNALE